MVFDAFCKKIKRSAGDILDLQDKMVGKKDFKIVIGCREVEII
jgi:hypothetical protein